MNGTKGQVRFYCPPPNSAGSSSPFGNMYLVSLGWLFCCVIMLPFGFVGLDDNVILQKGGFALLLAVIFVWLGLFDNQGFQSWRVPVVGSNFQNVLGVTLFNYAVITSIPSW